MIVDGDVVMWDCMYELNVKMVLNVLKVVLLYLIVS